MARLPCGCAALTGLLCRRATPQPQFPPSPFLTSYWAGLPKSAVETKVLNDARHSKATLAAAADPHPSSGTSLAGRLPPTRPPDQQLPLSLSLCTEAALSGSPRSWPGPRSPPCGWPCNHTRQSAERFCNPRRQCSVASLRSDGLWKLSEPQPPPQAMRPGSMLLPQTAWDHLCHAYPAPAPCAPVLPRPEE